ncbi:MAG: hypothetical protein O2955_06065 [Planctomycetota bacterium]|nr:hypothetical protein [Planctomycetota bacterium]MDA1212059.1 hypothetical protein [Planctomycetota bacterium]
MGFHKSIMRKRVWVNGLIQGRALTYISLYWVLYHFLLLHATFIYRIFRTRDSVLIGEDALPMTVLYGQFLSEHMCFICCAFIVLPIILFDALWFSHRIVGPLYRIRIALQQLAAGVELTPIRLRKGDYLGDIAEAVNHVCHRIEYLKEHHSDDDILLRNENGEEVNVVADRDSHAQREATVDPDLPANTDRFERDLIEQAREVVKSVNTRYADDALEQVFQNKGTRN